MHARHVAIQGVLLNRAVVTQWAAVTLLSQLPHHVDLKLAAAGEEPLAVWTLEARVREVQVQVLHQVGPFFKAAFAFWTHVGFE